MKEEIEKIKVLQDTIREDMLVQVGEEKEKSEGTVEEYQVDIATTKKQIDVNDQQVLELKEKISLVKTEDY